MVYRETHARVPGLTAEENIVLPVQAGAETPWEASGGSTASCSRSRIPSRDATSCREAAEFVAFARALMYGAGLLLDEPGEGIAPIFAQRMVEILDDLKKEGASVLVAESNDVHIARLLDRTFVIERGSIVDDG